MVTLLLSPNQMPIYQDYHSVIQSQPKLEILEHPAVLVLSLAVFAIGSTLVLTSFWALGFIGTFLGDYFGLYLDERVTGFPFSVFEHPMYTGVVFNLLGAALWYASPVGIFLTVFASLVYKLVVQFEGPFTAAIYDKKAAKEKEEKTQ
ncbi:phosphatidylethanolamine N-methyltransferase-like [Ptychodera flava]|uniref:phosphatidylethanolamine N-methyltransferase-like n=1 Tax=Ptychodera flava TaxID=63121 RepID=UPI00396A550F